MVDAALRLVPDPIARLYAAAKRTAEQRDVRRVALVLALLLAAAAFAYLMVNVYLGDSYGYWQSIRLDHLYYTADPDTAPHGYLYAPVFVQILWPLIMLPWEVFHAIWLAALVALLFWISGRWVALLIFALFFAPFAIGFLAAPRHYLSSGNIFLPMALAVVAGFRWPWTYSFLLLTKVTPGIGLLWFVARREWRNLFIALGATAAVVLVSFAFSWSLWFDWFTVLRNNVGNPEPTFAIQLIPLMPRLVLAAAMTIAAARYDARWVVPIAAMIALPYITDTALIMVVGVVPLLRHDAWTQGRPDGSDAAAQAAPALPAA